MGFKGKNNVSSTLVKSISSDSYLLTSSFVAEISWECRTDSYPIKQKHFRNTYGKTEGGICKISNR